MSEEKRPILVIDPRQLWLTFCTEALDRNGFQVFAAQSGEEALDLATRDLSAAVAPAIVDIQLVEADESLLPGLVTSDEGEKRTVVVVFSTGLTPDRARLAYSQGAFDCVNKPYDESSLLAMVEQMYADQRLRAAHGGLRRNRRPHHSLRA